MSNQKNRFKKAAICAVVIILLLAAVVSGAYADAAGTDQLQKQLEELKTQAKEIQSHLNQISSEKQNVQTKISSINAQIANLKEQINIIDQQREILDSARSLLESQFFEKEAHIGQMTEEIAEKEKQIAEKEEEYKAQYELSKDRIRAIYMSGGYSALDVIFGSGDSSDLSFYDKMEYMKAISDRDKEILESLVKIQGKITEEKEDIEVKMDLVEEEKAEIEWQEKQKEEDKKALDLKRQEREVAERQLEDLQIQLGNELRTLNAQEGEEKEREKITQQEMAKIQKEIEDLIRKYAEAQEASKYIGGQLQWPVPGYYSISMHYMGYVGHTGMDIVGKTQGLINLAPFVAAGPGKVIAVIKGNTGYGNYVIVDHGGGITTLYAHASSISVVAGQQVVAGQELGRVGSTGNSTGPHLHFEVRVNGAHQNPIKYVTLNG
jgi:murein DD-endopeptidase MepM/ murein hydrolase activator NlpD